MIVTQDMYEVTLQRNRIVHAKIELLTLDLVTIDELSGVVISGNTSIDSNSDIRRTCNISLVDKHRKYMNDETGGKYWLDKFIKLWTGVDNNKTGDIVWFNRGCYLINQPSLNYDSTTRTLSFSGVDLMAKLTKLRGGVLGGGTTQLKIGDNIRNIIIGLLNTKGFKEYIIDIPKEDTLNSELTFSADSSVYDIISSIRDTYYPFYQFYFDLDGIFRFEKIPTGDNQFIAVDSYMFDKLAISHSDTTDFEDVNNIIEVFGKIHEPSYYSSSVQVKTDSRGKYYHATISELEGVTVPIDVLIGMVMPELITNPRLKINNGNIYNIVDESGNFVKFKQGDTDLYYVFQSKSNSYYFVGHLQSYARVEDDNPESPFYIGTNLELPLVLTGGEYDLIMTDKQALDRANYELYQHTRLKDSIIIKTVPIYYLDVYDLIEFKLAGNINSYTYLIQSISGDIDPLGEQTINALRYYPEPE